MRMHVICPESSHWRRFLSQIVWVHIHSNLCSGLLKTNLFCNRVRFGRSRSSKIDDFGTNRKGVCNFLLVTNSNFGPILHRSWDTVNYWLEIAYFSYPFLIRHPRSLCSLWNFALKLTTRKIVMGLSSYEDPMIVAGVILTHGQRVTDRQTDGRIYYS